MNLTSELAKTTWPDSLQLWPEINIGTILGCGDPNIPGQNNQQLEQQQQPRQVNSRSKTRLLQVYKSSYPKQQTSSGSLDANKPYKNKSTGTPGEKKKQDGKTPST
jgi:hypothetical protein